MTMRRLPALVAGARDKLHKLTPKTVNAHEGAEMWFEGRESKLTFTSEGFQLSFSLPSSYFHAAYDILRFKGVPVGTRHFMGRCASSQIVRFGRHWEVPARSASTGRCEKIVG